MQTSMSITTLASTIKEHVQNKRDFIANTRAVSVVPGKKGLNLCVQDKEYSLSQHANFQIADRLKIPRKYYDRLLSDHPDLILHQVNALFTREPEFRMFRVLNDEVRAFLSDQYMLLDNDEVLANALPVIMDGGYETTLLSSNVSSEKMYLKVLFTDDRLAHEVAKARGEPRIIRPGFVLSNSEVGSGSLRIDTFFYDSFCTNGCVWGKDEAFSYSRNHVSNKQVIDGDYQVVSVETRRLEDQLVMSKVKDAVTTISDPVRVEKMANSLRQAHQSEKVINPVGAIEKAVKDLSLNNMEHMSFIETFLRDQDYSKFGMASAITEIANKPEVCSYERACELERIGGRMMALPDNQWQEYARVPLAA